MNDDAMMTMIRDGLAPARLDAPLDAVVDRGMRLRRRHRAVKVTGAAAAVTAVAAAGAAALAPAGGPGHAPSLKARETAYLIALKKEMTGGGWPVFVKAGPPCTTGTTLNGQPLSALEEFQNGDSTTPPPDPQIIAVSPVGVPAGDGIALYPGSISTSGGTVFLHVKMRLVTAAGDCLPG